LASALLVAPIPAIAQEAAAVSKAESRPLEMARDLIGTIYPVERRDRMIIDMATSLGIQSAAPRIKEIEDEGAQQIVADHVAGMMGRMRPLLQVHIPKMLDAMAYAYAETFTYAELEAIRDFARTEAGKAYFSRSPALVNHPRAVEVNKSLFNHTKIFSEAEQEALRQKLQAYFESNAQAGSQPGSRHW
jgi:hypothetical protein